MQQQLKHVSLKPSQTKSTSSRQDLQNRPKLSSKHIFEIRKHQAKKQGLSVILNMYFPQN